MTLSELIHRFRHDSSFERFCREQSLEADSEAIEIFAQAPLSLESPLGFFEIEKTGGSITYSHGDQDYRNLFDFYFFLDAIEALKNEQNQDLQDDEVAQKLLSYAIHDA